jgi:FtsP/CotA-like multicopper oxidase with cupredoxin domain
MRRRDFLKYGLGGVAALVVGSKIPWLMEDEAYAAVHTQTLNIHITDALKDMVTHNAINTAQCYFWIFKEDNFPAECPGPNIFTTQGDVVRLVITNDLDEPHSLYIPDMFDSGPIAPGAKVTKFFTATTSGSYLYYDNLNAPVNRMMGLHGAFIVMPRAAAAGHKFTPYDNPTPMIQKLFDELGVAPYPGLSWEQGDPATSTPAFRQHIWVSHEASPVLFAEVGNAAPGTGARVPATFVNAISNDPYADTFNRGVFNRKPHFFTINGQSGHFAHNNPFICPNHRVGEPCVIRVLSAGMSTHSMHIHANHVYVLSEGNQLSNNVLWVDTMTNTPLRGFDWLVPYMRPPDVPNLRGIGRADAPLPTLSGLTWPPTEELDTFLPPVGTLADPLNPLSVDISVRLSPLCYPMHSHSEATQTAQGGNYNLGLISGLNFTGDRNTPGGVTTFPRRPTQQLGPDKTGPAAG